MTSTATKACGTDDRVMVNAGRMGLATVDLDHALDTPDDLEDAENIRKLAQHR